ncbi:hypothetical protein NRY67_01695 [Acidithiobacillus ferrooxidans]|nr:hypothetical protein [Acidithiobacillus ferrooxidans]MCR1341312.1 hypothetical protein [Acidithiobacillus ferrooxidans]
MSKSEAGKYRLKFMPEALEVGKRESMAAYLSAARRLPGGE